jgi:peptide/nickel transport system permease protein
MEKMRSTFLFRFWKTNHLWLPLLLLFFALTADFWAGELPLLAKKDGAYRLPALEYRLSEWGLIKTRKDLLQADLWTSDYAEKTIFPPIRYNPNKTDAANDRFQKPHALRDDSPKGSPHYLGTDELGHDVAAILIHGCRISLLIGLVSMLLAACIGILPGALAGFWGDSRLRLNRVQWSLSLLGTSFFLYYLAFPIPKVPYILAPAGVFITTYFSMKKSAGIDQRKFPVPLDFIISRITEWAVIFPKLMLILAVAAVSKPSIWLPALVIGVISWPSFLRYTRAEMLHVRQADYIKSAEIVGLSSFRIFFMHALPNSLNPIPSVLAFGIAGAVLAESSLSFLGIGLPPEVFTWGKLLAQGRLNPTAWWVTLLPGLLIFATISSFHRLGEQFSRSKEGKKQAIIRYFR